MEIAAIWYFVIVMGGFTNTVGPFINEADCNNERQLIWNEYKTVIGRTYVSPKCFQGGKK